MTTSLTAIGGAPQGRRIRQVFKLHDLWSYLYIMGMTCTVIYFSPQIPDWRIYICYHVAALGLMGLALYGYEAWGGGFWRAIRTFYPLILISAAFRELHFLIPHVNPTLQDGLLERWDTAILGHPLKGLLDQVTIPLLSQFLHLCYLSYFLLPFILLITLMIRKKEEAVWKSLAHFLFGWYLSFAGYLILPALGPQHVYSVAANPGIDAGIGAGIRRFLLDLEWQIADAFPSGHTLVALLILWCAWRFERRLFWVLVVPITGLVMGTVYLRYHYLVDILAAMGCWIIVVSLTPGLYRRWNTGRL